MDRAVDLVLLSPPSMELALLLLFVILTGFVIARMFITNFNSVIKASHGVIYPKKNNQLGDLSMY